MTLRRRNSSRRRSANSIRTLCILIAALSVTNLSVVAQESQQPPLAPVVTPPFQRPPYELVRYEENWSFLQDPAKRVDYMDFLKYIPLQSGEGPTVPYLSIGGEIRTVYERIQNDNFSAVPYPTNEWPTERLQVFVDAHLKPRLRFFLQFESGLEQARLGGYRPIDEKRLDFLNAFVDLGIGPSKYPITLRAGRQEFNLGSGRFLAVREGPNVRQSFYGFRVTQHIGKWTSDGLAVRPAEDNPRFFDNIPLNTTQFWGLYNTRQWTPKRGDAIDVYYFGIDRKNAVFDSGTHREVRQTLGVRASLPPPTSIANRTFIPHYDVEAAYQFGSFGKGSIHAWTVATELGSIWPKLPFTPHLGVRSDVSSGNRDRNGPNLQTFNALFPIGNYFGVISDTGPGPVNFIDVHPDLKLTLPHGVIVDPSWVIQWRESVHDGLYGVPGNLLVSSGKSEGRFTGHRPGVEVHWQIDRHSYIQADYGVFYAGPWLRQSGYNHSLNYTSFWAGYVF